MRLRIIENWESLTWMLVRSTVINHWFKINRDFHVDSTSTDAFEVKFDRTKARLFLFPLNSAVLVIPYTRSPLAQGIFFFFGKNSFIISYRQTNVYYIVLFSWLLTNSHTPCDIIQLEHQF